jgi:hypothetical protein
MWLMVPVIGRFDVSEPRDRVYARNETARRHDEQRLGEHGVSTNSGFRKLSKLSCFLVQVYHARAWHHHCLAEVTISSQIIFVMTKVGFYEATPKSMSHCST